MTDWPQDPNGDMAPILEQSIAAAKARHPSGKDPAMNATAPNTFTAADRCDQCSAAASVRVTKTPETLEELEFSTPKVLDFCGHHYQDHAADLFAQGWTVTMGSPTHADKVAS